MRVREIARLQVDYQRLLKNGITKKAMCELVIPFRDKYKLNDKDALAIARNEMSINEICNLMDRAQQTNSVTVQEWVSVKDRLPNDSVAVNLHTISGVVGTGFYNKYTKSWVQWYAGNSLCVDVTHWQPLPQPPKGE